MENEERRESRAEATGYSSSPTHPTSTTIPGGAHKPLGVKVAEFLGMDTEDSYRATAGDGPSTAEPLPTEGAMGTGHVRRSIDATTMEQDGGRRVSIAAATAGMEVPSAGTSALRNDETGASNFDTIAGATSTGNPPSGVSSERYAGDQSNTGTYHDSTTIGTN